MYDRADVELSESEWKTGMDVGGESKSEKSITTPPRLNRILQNREEKTGIYHYEIVCNFDFDGKIQSEKIINKKKKNKKSMSFFFLFEYNKVRSKYFHSNVLQDPVQDCSSGSMDPPK